jgi:hypothetical protein
MSLLNPWVLLAIVLAIGTAGATGYYKGHTAAQDAARAQFATELEATIAEHNANAAIDMQAAADNAAREAAARTRTAMLRGRANEITVAKPMPVSCNLDSDRFGLLVAAVKEANGDSADAAGRVRDAAKSVNSTIR